MAPDNSIHYKFDLETVTFIAIQQQTCEQEFSNWNHNTFLLHHTQQLDFIFLLFIYF